MGRARDGTGGGLPGMGAVGLLGLLAGCSLAGPRPPSPPPLIPPKNLVLPLPRTPDTLNPLAGGPIAARLHAFILEGLVRLDATTGRVAPALADRWEATEGTRVWHFHLREGVRWSDGEPFGAWDVTFTLGDLVQAMSIRNPYRPLLDFGTGAHPRFPEVEPIGDRTVRIALPEPFPALPRALANIPILPRHRLEADFEAGLLPVAWRVGDPGTRAVGTGPFTVDRVRPGLEVRLRRNYHYWRRGDDGERLPRIDGVTLRVISGDPIEAIRRGEIDILVAAGAEADRLAAHRGAGYRVREAGPVGESTFLTFRQGDSGAHALFADPRFRRAVSYALDRSRMIAEVLDGRGRPQWSPISPADPFFHHDGVRSYPHDPRRAAALLDAAGAVDRNRDGIRETPDGLVLDIEILVPRAPAAAPHVQGIGRRVTADLRAVGIRARAVEVSWEEILDAIGDDRWDALLGPLPQDYDPHLLARFWTTDGAMHIWEAEGAPAPAWQDEIDRLFGRAADTADDEERRALYRRFQEIAAEQVPMLYTVQRVPLVAIRRRVQGFRPTPVGLLADIAHLDLEG